MSPLLTELATEALTPLLVLPPTYTQNDASDLEKVEHRGVMQSLYQQAIIKCPLCKGLDHGPLNGRPLLDLHWPQFQFFIPIRLCDH